jgi:hypothetical protein
VDLLILPVIWAAVLIPPWIRRRREGRPAESILTFHRKLWELERTSLYSDAAYSDAAYYSDADAGVGHGYADEVDDGYAERPVRRVESPSSPSSAPSAPSAAQRKASRSALRRRRQIFFSLLLGLMVSLAFAAALRTPLAWGVHIGVSALFVGYISLLVRHHQRVVEQVEKVRYLTPIRAPRPGVVVLRSGTAR